MSSESADAVTENAFCRGCNAQIIKPQNMTVLIWAPQEFTLEKMAAYFEKKSESFEVLAEANAIKILPLDSQALIVQLIGLTTPSERLDTRILLFEGQEPTLADYGHIATLAEVSRRYRGQWVLDLIARKRIYSVGQPIVDASDLNVFGHEMLMRGVDEDGETVMPGALLDSARDPRILFNLDREARLSAVRTAAKHLPDGNIFINFTPGSVYDPGTCLRTTVNAINKLDIDPKRVVFEVIETEKIEDIAHLKGIIQFYRDAGFKIALDDFGTGFNNIGTYLTLDPDFIKLDKSITAEFISSPKSREFVESFIERCHKGVTRVIAEGIENAETADAMIDAGIDYMQGYHFGRPASLGRV